MPVQLILRMPNAALAHAVVRRGFEGRLPVSVLEELISWWAPIDLYERLDGCGGQRPLYLVSRFIGSTGRASLQAASQDLWRARIGQCVRFLMEYPQEMMAAAIQLRESGFVLG